MYVLRTNADLEPWRADTAWVAFVPTMGALHEGHESLIRQAAAAARGHPGGACLVSIFVNPTQFNDPADLARYPRTIENDLECCRRSGADAIYVPGPEDIYPPGESIPIPPLPDVAILPQLEDSHRPGHFAGVCQVVLRLLRLARPHEALFGEKDWQQFRVIDAMVESLGLPIRVVPIPTMRESDGLAMSSRNRFLSPAERRRAASLALALEGAARLTDPGQAQRHMADVLTQAGATIEYAVVREARSLMPISPGTFVPGATPRRALIAARIGSVRLIDNAPWPASLAGA
ncbi:MAG: pantoate--beta-alanine ligase [Phycisphaeraceae bacterium]|nr:pantoate--beta-alanine ligase [Phycisphaerae bacterium]MBX3391555.1 pantoate--beta-alanine ligase [Phycisphaeraceae bacterium]